jgi:hypothetical protein
MKPTATQIALMELVKSHLSALTRSNDITSPTVLSDFEEDMWVYDLKKYQTRSFSKAFNDLLITIRDVK